MTDVKTVFGETLRRHRTKSNRSQQDVATRCDMSFRYYQELEAGTKQPTITTLFKLADSLEESPATLIEEAYKTWQSSASKASDD
ncbi:helix-turn-helix domain-containing protein [Teredinibacter purpureus]|uniref:helix-turn-helix domain-containing protein n=1 Tax=Teredinibacter purpureus TaxID=2731756 RepID=UPI000698C2AA|nr:helix-turn-helix transcriptional regulator [Teredinibacter purpureus]